MKRFYKTVAVGGDNAILLDGRTVKTPAGAPLAPPSRALAEAVADEWRRQGDKVVPASMPLTKLANTAIDQVPRHREALIKELTGFGGADLLSYRAEEGALAARQAAQWDELLDWANETLDAHLSVTTGLVHVPQPPETLAAFARVLAAQDDWTLSALQTLTTITGSLVLALAVAAGELTTAEAFALSRLDEDYQAEKWGEDHEARKRADALAAELDSAGKFIALARA
ncbi:MAG: ATP12 family protein [Rhizomicrobium sp.]